MEAAIIIAAAIVAAIVIVRGFALCCKREDKLSSEIEVRRKQMEREKREKHNE